jgi:hypothetical protein
MARGAAFSGDRSDVNNAITPQDKQQPAGFSSCFLMKTSLISKKTCANCQKISLVII